MAKQTRSRLSYRKNDRKRPPAKKKTVKIAPVLISEKSKVIKKPPAKRGRKKTAPIKEAVISVARNSKGRLSSRTSSQITQTATEETEQSTPDMEFKTEKPDSPSVFIDRNPVLLQRVLGDHAPTSRTANASGVHSQSVSPSVIARANPVGRIANSQPISSTSQRPQESQDNYLNFILSGSQADTKNTTDCGIQCAIIEQRDSSTLTPPIISELDLLDEMFLSEVAGRFDIDRQAMLEVSQEVLTDFVLVYNLSEVDEVDDEAFGEETSNNSLISGNENYMDLGFDYEFPDDASGNADPMSLADSIISGTPSTPNYYH